MTTLLTGGGTRGTTALDDDVDLARDRVLVTRAQAGDRSAFDDLYMRYYRRLYRFCLRRLHDSHEAEDVAQEAFARAWRALPTFGGDRRFYPWLSVIASHLCTDVLRRRNRSTPVAEFHQSNVASTDDGGEEIMLAAVDSDLVARAFTRLSERHQRILHLREGSGWSYQRIADHEGVGITAVETLLWRARQALKREFASLAGAEGRMGAFVGGALSLASLRKLLRLPSRALRKVATTSAKGGVLAAGSAVAATAMVIGAALSSPVPTTISSSSHGGSPGVLGHTLAPLAPITSLPLPVSSTTQSGSSITGGSDTTSGNGLAGTGASPSGTPNLPTGGSQAPLGDVPAAAPIGNALNTAGNTLGTVGNTVDQVTGGVLSTVADTVDGITDTLGDLTGGSTSTSDSTSTSGSDTASSTNPVSDVGDTVGSVLNDAGSTESSGSGVVGTALGSAGKELGLLGTALFGGS